MEPEYLDVISLGMVYWTCFSHGYESWVSEVAIRVRPSEPTTENTSHYGLFWLSSDASIRSDPNIMMHGNQGLCFTESVEK